MNAGNGPGAMSAVPRGAVEQENSHARNCSKTAPVHAPNAMPRLPPDLWAEVLLFLPFGAALQCTAVCRAFLHEVAPIVREISVVKSGELRVKFAQRFRGVRKVQIGCLFKYPAMTPRDELKRIDFDCIDDIRASLFGQEVDDNGFRINDVDSDVFQIDDLVVSRTTPFLTAFTNLRETDVGGFFVSSRHRGVATRLGVYWFYGEKIQMEVDDSGDEYGRVYRDESTRKEDGELMRALEMSIGGAYSSGAISQSCEIHGVGARCPKVDHQICPHCVRVSKCFPVPYAINRFFEKDYVYGWAMDGLRSSEELPNYDATAIECLRTVFARREGKEYLNSEEYLYKLLFGCDDYGCLSKPAHQQVLTELVRFSQIDRQTMLNLLYRKKLICEEDARILIALGLPVEISDVEMLKEMSRKEGRPSDGSSSGAAAVGMKRKRDESTRKEDGLMRALKCAISYMYSPSTSSTCSGSSSKSVG